MAKKDKIWDYTVYIYEVSGQQQYVNAPLQHIKIWQKSSLQVMLPSPRLQKKQREKSDKFQPAEVLYIAWPGERQF